MNHFQIYEIFRPEKYGFHKLRSCKTELLDFSEELSKNMEQGHQADIIVMDFA